MIKILQQKSKSKIHALFFFALTLKLATKRKLTLHKIHNMNFSILFDNKKKQ